MLVKFVRELHVFTSVVWCTKANGCILTGIAPTAAANVAETVRAEPSMFEFSLPVQTRFVIKV